MRVCDFPRYLGRFPHLRSRPNGNCARAAARKDPWTYSKVRQIHFLEVKSILADHHGKTVGLKRVRKFLKDNR